MTGRTRGAFRREATIDVEMEPGAEKLHGLDSLTQSIIAIDPAVYSHKYIIITFARHYGFPAESGWPASANQERCSHRKPNGKLL